MRVIALTVPLCVPYKRLPHQLRHSKIAHRYHASRDELMLAMSVAALLDRGSGQVGISGPYRVDLRLAIPRRKPRRKGETTTARATGGDADNYLKAILDAAVRGGIVDGDGPNLYLGGTVVSEVVDCDPGFMTMRITEAGTPRVWTHAELAEAFGRELGDPKCSSEVTQIVRRHGLARTLKGKP